MPVPHRCTKICEHQTSSFKRNPANISDAPIAHLCLGRGNEPFSVMLGKFRRAICVIGKMQIDSVPEATANYSVVLGGHNHNEYNMRHNTNIAYEYRYLQSPIP